MTTPNKPDHASRGHHPQGPSQLKALSQCAGFENRPGTSAAAEMGTRIHEALEIRDPTNLQSELELEIYEKCVRAEDALIADFFGGEEYDRFNELHVTVPLNSGYEIDGTGDVLCVNKARTRAIMIDYKTGVMKVDDAEVNLQGKAYKNGTFALYPTLETIRFVFLAPQLDLINWHDFERETEELDRQHITQIVANAQRVSNDWAMGRVDPDDLNPCDQCTWCRHQSYCPAVNGLLLDFATAAGLHPPDHIDLNRLSDPAEVAEMYKVAKVLEPVINKIKGAATELALEGEVLPGLELRSNGATSVSDDNRGLFEYVQSWGITLEDLLDSVNIPVAKLRDLASARAPRGQKKKVAEEFERQALDKGVIRKGKERFHLRAETAED